MIDKKELRLYAERASKPCKGETLESCANMDALYQLGFRSRATPLVVIDLLDELEKVDADRKACWAEFKALRRSADENERYLREELEQCRNDSERLNLLADHVVIEGFVGVEKDIYDISCEVAESNGREEPGDDDQRQALRLLIDAFCAKDGGANG